MEKSTKIIIGIGIVILIALIVWLIFGMSNKPTTAPKSGAGTTGGTSSGITDLINTGVNAATGGSSSTTGLLGFSQDGIPLFSQLGDTQDMVVFATKAEYDAAKALL
jgi:hypothetical protein